MPNAHIREIAKFGVVTDVDPYDLPITAWSMGVNVRFKNQKISRAPVFRDVDTTLMFDDPRYLAVNAPSTGFDTLYISYLNGKATTYDNGIETDVSPVSWVPSDSEEVVTSCFEGDVFYLNRADRVPWYQGSTDVAFANLPNWDANWRTKLLRAYAGALVALNVTLDGVAYPTRILTSEFTTVGNVPSTWDFTVPTNNATSNFLAEMEGPIVDAATLRDAMIIYGRKEAWVMQLNPGSEEVYAYQRIFTGGRGAINADCAVEVEGKHYVFGPDDIWVHDGNSDQSIAAGSVREFIYSTMNISEARRFYTFHNTARKEIDFNYVSGDPYVGFNPDNGSGCNRKATYDYVNGTWTFDDLPFIHDTVLANIDQSLTYDTVTATYDTIGGSYLDQEDSLKKTTIMIGSASAAEGVGETLYAFDLQGPGSTVAYAVNEVATKGPYGERLGLDLDEIAADLNGYKTCSSLYPEARLEPGAAPLEFSVGSADYANQSIIWKDYQTFDGDALYKLDFNSAGRFLAIRFRHQDYHWFTLSGFDADLDVVAER